MHEATLFHINLDILLCMSVRNRSPISLVNLGIMEPAIFLIMFATSLLVKEVLVEDAWYSRVLNYSKSLFHIVVLSLDNIGK